MYTMQHRMIHPILSYPLKIVLTDPNIKAEDSDPQALEQRQPPGNWIKFFT